MTKLVVLLFALLPALSLAHVSGTEMHLHADWVGSVLLLLSLFVLAKFIFRRIKRK